MDNLARAKKAFIEADKAGNAEDAQFFLNYIKQQSAAPVAQAEEGPGLLERGRNAIVGAGKEIAAGLNPFGANQNIAAARDPNAPAEDVARLRQSQALLQGGLDGATMGFSDEIAALPQSLIQGRGYGDVVAERDAATRALQAANPGASLLGGLVGGLTTGGVGAARALGSQAVRSAAPLVRGMASAGVGAGTGAAAGAGYSAPGERGEGALVGGVLGGALGVAVPAVGRLAGAAKDKIMAAVSVPSREKMATDFIAKYAARDGIDPAQLSQKVAAGGPNTMPVDAGPNLKSLGEYIGQRTGEGKTIAEKALHARDKGQQPRIMAAFKKAAGIEDEAALAARDPKIAQQFTESLDDLVDIGPGDAGFLRLLERPSLSTAWKKASELAREEGAKMPKLKDFTKAVRSGEPQRVETRVLHWLKKGLDDVLEPKRDPTTGKVISDTGKNELKAREETRRAFRGILKEKSPRYAEALDQTAGELRNRSSFFLGRDALGEDLRSLQTQVGRLKGKDLDAFRQGYVEAVSEATRVPGGKGYDVSLRAMDEDGLRTVFGDKADDLIKELWRERGMRGTSNKITGGSQTFSRMETARDLEGAGAGAGIVGDIASNPTPGGMLSAVVRRFAQALTGEKRPPSQALEHAAKVLFSSDPAEIQRIISASRNVTARPGARPSDIPSWLVGAGAHPLNPEVISQKRGR